jgi:hypothetical protein
MWRCKHVKSWVTTVYFKLGRLGTVSTHVQQMWGIIGHVTVEAGKHSRNRWRATTKLRISFMWLFFIRIAQASLVLLDFRGWLLTLLEMGLLPGLARRLYSARRLGTFATGSSLEDLSATLGGFYIRYLLISFIFESSVPWSDRYLFWPTGSGSAI